MPSGLAHRRIAGLVLFLIILLTVYAYDDLTSWFGQDPAFEFVLLFGLSFLGGTYLLSPDLDLEDSDPAKSWGIVQVIWRPYAKVFRHRGLSHTPVVGTLTRVLYLGCVIYVVGSVVQSLLGLGLRISVYDLDRLLTPQAGCVLAGLICADLVHLLADRFFSR